MRRIAVTFFTCPPNSTRSANGWPICAITLISARLSPPFSKELATVYADEKIERARNFLKQRQEEVNLFNSRLDQAKGITSEMKHWLHEVELEESVAAAQLDRLRAEMREIMPELGIERTVSADEMARDSRVVELPPKAAE